MSSSGEDDGDFVSSNLTFPFLWQKVGRSWRHRSFQIPGASGPAWCGGCPGSSWGRTKPGNQKPAWHAGLKLKLKSSFGFSGWSFQRSAVLSLNHDASVSLSWLFSKAFMKFVTWIFSEKYWSSSERDPRRPYRSFSKIVKQKSKKTAWQ